VLTTLGIWHSIIKDKYLCHHSVKQLAAIEDCYHQGDFLLLEEFNKNKTFDNPLALLASRLGHSITLGRDHILGLDDASILPPQLVAHLTHKKYMVSLPS
jgi:hypothetical protein